MVGLFIIRQVNDIGDVLKLMIGKLSGSIIAIGGLHKDLLPEIKRRGAHAAAVIGAVFNHDNPPQAFVDLCEAWG